MTDAPTPDSLTADELAHLRRCVDLAEEAVAAGDDPFGSVLVGADGRVLAEDRNREASARDFSAHPEFALARWAFAHLSPAERAAATVFTSGEHCPMCSAAHGWAGLGRIVFVASAEQTREWRSRPGDAPSPVASLPASLVLPGTQVVGPVAELEERIRGVYRSQRG